MKYIFKFTLTTLALLWAFGGNAQPQSPTPTKVHEGAAAGITVLTDSGKEIKYMFPTFKQIDEAFIAGNLYISPLPSKKDRYTLLVHLTQMCVPKAILATGVMAGKIDNRDQEDFLKIATEITEKYKMPPYVAIDYQRIVRQGYRTSLDPTTFIDNEYLTCLRRGW